MKPSTEKTVSPDTMENIELRKTCPAIQQFLYMMTARKLARESDLFIGMGTSRTPSCTTF